MVEPRYVKPNVNNLQSGMIDLGGRNLYILTQLLAGMGEPVSLLFQVILSMKS